LVDIDIDIDSDVNGVDSDVNGSCGKDCRCDEPSKQSQRNRQTIPDRNININDNNDINSVVFSSLEGNPNKYYPCSYVAECDLPTDIGSFRLREYRITDNKGEVGDGVQKNKWLGCLIYCADKPLFGCDGEKVPIRIHDQCFTSEVFGSRR